MKPNVTHIAALILYYAGLALVWLYAGIEWRDAVFYLTFFSAFFLTSALGYLLWKAEQQLPPTE